MVRVAGVEPAISWSQTTRLTIKPLPGYIATIVDKTLQLPFLSLERLNLRVQSYITFITNSNKFTRSSHSSFGRSQTGGRRLSGIESHIPIPQLLYIWQRQQDSNLRSFGYEPNALANCAISLCKNKALTNAGTRI